nr:DUF6525 family protein [Gluconacetobacter dulcium]
MLSAGGTEAGTLPVAGNERTVRHEMWRRYDGDDWEAFDVLPPAIRQRVAEHAYDAWSVNVMVLWRHYRRLHGRTPRAERALIRYLDYCERLERAAFAARYAQAYGAALPHDAAGATILRGRPADASVR